jgi:alpha-amylase/alpha-mannosidase (GH57 family)
MNRYICIHGHFYQPPRENPWLEHIEAQDSAAPYHDWNERITAECYAPNSHARLLNHAGKVQDIVSNYAQMSFNFGPTLLSWMNKFAPDAYKDIVESNKKSMQRFGGHPSALAQVYNHIIMPLANAKDKRTQVLWGIRDYESRFGVKPEGIWLAETAVCLPTLETLAEAGILYTVLSPYQAKRYRKNRSHTWVDAVGGKMDPTHPYIQKLPSGKQIAIFFYDGPISQSIAFDGLLKDGKKFADRLVSAFLDSRHHTQLVSIATDGETYGHHHQFGEMALAYALNHIEKSKLAKLTNYGQFLALFPPQDEVEILEHSAWSCSHGVERWKSHCGCNTGGRPSWNQHWRGPLRESFDFLRDTLAPLYEKKIGRYVKDPWLARDHYIDVMLNRSRDQIDRFFAEHQTHSLSPAEKTSALNLLELQRHAMLMYTSCGWFFDELSGIETVQCMQYAGRVVQLAHDEFDDLTSLESDFLKHLSKAKGNTSRFPDGQAIYRSLVKPAMIDLLKVASHHAVASIFTPKDGEESLYSYRVFQEHIRIQEAGKATLVVGKARISSEITLEHANIEFGALHFGDHTINAGVRHHVCDDSFAIFVNESLDAFSKMDFPCVLRSFDKHFGSSTYSLKSLFKDEQRKVLNTLLTETSTELAGIYNKIYLDHYTLMRFLVETNNPLPRALSSVSGFVIDHRLRHIFAEPDLNLDLLKQTLDDAARWKSRWDEKDFSHLFKLRAERLAKDLVEKPHSLELLAQLEEFVSITKTLPFPVNLWRVQNDYFFLAKTALPSFAAKLTPEEKGNTPWCVLFRSLGDQLAMDILE